MNLDNVIEFSASYILSFATVHVMNEYDDITYKNQLKGSIAISFLIPIMYKAFNNLYSIPHPPKGLKDVLVSSVMLTSVMSSSFAIYEYFDAYNQKKDTYDHLMHSMESIAYIAINELFPKYILFGAFVLGTSASSTISLMGSAFAAGFISKLVSDHINDDRQIDYVCSTVNGVNYALYMTLSNSLFSQYIAPMGIEFATALLMSPEVREDLKHRLSGDSGDDQCKLENFEVLEGTCPVHTLY